MFTRVYVISEGGNHIAFPPVPYIASLRAQSILAVTVNDKQYFMASVIKRVCIHEKAWLVFVRLRNTDSHTWDQESKLPIILEEGDELGRWMGAILETDFERIKDGNWAPN